jgi:hypothetical protein
VLEAGFLILLAAVVGLAELRPALIVLVMAVGWLLVALIEYLAWRQTAGFPTVQRYATAAAPPPVTPPPAEEETIVAPAEAEPPPADVEEAVDSRPERQMEPPTPRPRRRWIIFGPRVRREGDREEER